MSLVTAMPIVCNLNLSKLFRSAEELANFRIDKLVIPPHARQAGNK